jgi:hypothetical protein
MLEIYVLVFSILIILSIIYLLTPIYENMNMNENFTNQTHESFENYYLSSCPSGYKSFYNTHGDIICCDGDIVANKCIGNRQCTINGRGTSDMPHCVAYLKQEYNDKSKSQCSASMPYYYEDKANNKKGCTSGALNNTMTGPKSDSQPICNIYDTLDANKNNKDSCYNQQLLDTMPCFGNNCTKYILQPIPNKPALIAFGFTDTMGIYNTAYTRESLQNYLDAVNPLWQNSGIDLTKNIHVAQVAKAYYIDKTLSQSDIQL